jgi:Glycosyl transferases group 1
MQSAREHRLLISNIYKRSSFFIANGAKFNHGKETHGQEEIGFRFFEGVSSGAVLLGRPPRTPAFEEYLGWEDSVIEIPYDCPDIADIIREFEGQRERLSAARSRNVRNSAQRHDWLHRWARILEHAGLDEGPAMATRRSRLNRLAASFDSAGSTTESGDRMRSDARGPARSDIG